MNDPDKFVGLLGATMALFLAWRNLRSRGIGAQRTLVYAVIWVIVIAGLALIFARLGARA